MDGKLLKHPGWQIHGILLYCIVWVAGNGTLKAQNSDLSLYSSPQSEWAVPRFADDFAYILSSPARINENSVYALGGFSAFTAGVIFTLDPQAYERFNTKNLPISRDG